MSREDVGQRCVPLDRTHVFAASVVCLKDQRLFDSLLDTVSPARWQRVCSLRSKADQCLSLGVEILLKKSLESLDIPLFPVERDPWGKPYAVGREDVHFNLSHAGERVLCAVSPMPVGCDVEVINPRHARLGERYFCPSEQNFIREGQTEAERLERFYRLWTVKESFIKAVGRGLSLPMKDFCVAEADGGMSVSHTVDQGVYRAWEYGFDDGYRYAVCGLCDRCEDVVWVDLSL